MKTAFVFSILVKAIGAILELACQIVITRIGGVEVFGLYSYYVAIVEVICWLAFSGIAKTNIYYVSQGRNTNYFRKRFALLFALPIALLIGIVGLAYSALFIVIATAAYLYFLQMDLSSVFLACRRYRISLMGEYLVSRLTMFVGILVLVRLGALNANSLLVLYALGFMFAVIFFIFRSAKLELPVAEVPEGERKRLARRHVNYQLTDVANGVISQVPLIVQFAFTGAYQAGVLAVVLVARKIINFVAGPTAKVYLPEFARFHARGDMEGLRQSYRAIVLLQMVFTLPIGYVMCCAPEAVLYFYNEELVAYSDYLVFASWVFVLIALFGPQGGLLSMVGLERVETITRWFSLAVMIVAMVATHSNNMFVLYGIAAQVVSDSAIKFYFLVRALGGSPLRGKDLFGLFVPVVCLSPLSFISSDGLLAQFVLVLMGAVILAAIELVIFFRDDAKRIISSIL